MAAKLLVLRFMAARLLFLLAVALLLRFCLSSLLATKLWVLVLAATLLRRIKSLQPFSDDGGNGFAVVFGEDAVMHFGLLYFGSGGRVELFGGAVVSGSGGSSFSGGGGTRFAHLQQPAWGLGISCFPFVGILYRAPGFVLGVVEVLLGSLLRSGGRQRQIFYLHLLRQDGGRGTFSGLDASRGRSVALDDAAISKVWSILLDLVGGLDSGTGVHGRRRPEMRTTMMSSCVCLVVVVSLCSRVFDVKWGGTVLKF